MLPRIYRLPLKTKLIPQQTIHLSFARVKLARNTLSYSRFGVIIPKGTASSAVERNRIRRLLQGSFQRLQKQILSGYDILFVINRSVLHENSETLYQQIGQQLVKDSLIHE